MMLLIPTLHELAAHLSDDSTPNNFSTYNITDYCPYLPL